MKITTKEIVLSALFTALIIISGYISIQVPFSPVPITGQTLAIMIIGMLLSVRMVSFSVGTYILLGAIGLPVFSGFRGGLSVLVGPTGGYIIGFLVGAIVISLLKGDGKSLPRMVLAGFVGGILVIHLMGASWLGFQLQRSFTEAAMLGSIPYLIGDALKLALASILAVELNKRIDIARYTI